MNRHNAFSYDKFQIAGALTGEAIIGYFHDMHHLALINLSYSANQILYDVATRYVKETGRTVPSLFQNTRNNSQDIVLENYRPSANFIKHADRDWNKYRDIDASDVLGYLNALTYDYNGLRDELLKSGYIKRHDEAQKKILGFEGGSHVDLLAEILPQYFQGVLFGETEGFMACPLKDYCPEVFTNIPSSQKKEIVLGFLQDNKIGFNLSGGLPDYYMTKVARPILK